jgi:hypothetical protein
VKATLVLDRYRQEAAAAQLAARVLLPQASRSSSSWVVGRSGRKPAPASARRTGFQSVVGSIWMLSGIKAVEQRSDAVERHSRAFLLRSNLARQRPNKAST